MAKKKEKAGGLFWCIYYSLLYHILGDLSTVDDVNHPRSPVSDNTRKVIRKKVAILQPLQPICNLFATFQKHHQQAENPYTTRVYSVHIYICNLCNLFSRVLVYRENFFYFLFFHTTPKNRLQRLQI